MSDKDDNSCSQIIREFEDSVVNSFATHSMAWGRAGSDQNYWSEKLKGLWLKNKTLSKHLNNYFASNDVKSKEISELSLSEKDLTETSYNQREDLSSIDDNILIQTDHCQYSTNAHCYPMQFAPPLVKNLVEPRINNTDVHCSGIKRKTSNTFVVSPEKIQNEANSPCFSAKRQKIEEKGSMPAGQIQALLNITKEEEYLASKMHEADVTISELTSILDEMKNKLISKHNEKTELVLREKNLRKKRIQLIKDLSTENSCETNETEDSYKISFARPDNFNKSYESSFAASFGNEREAVDEIIDTYNVGGEGIGFKQISLGTLKPLQLIDSINKLVGTSKKVDEDVDAFAGFVENDLTCLEQQTSNTPKLMQNNILFYKANESCNRIREKVKEMSHSTSSDHEDVLKSHVVSHEHTPMSIVMDQSQVKDSDNAFESLVINCDNMSKNHAMNSNIIAKSLAVDRDGTPKSHVKHHNNMLKSNVENCDTRFEGQTKDCVNISESCLKSHINMSTNNVNEHDNSSKCLLKDHNNMLKNQARDCNNILKNLVRDCDNISKSHVKDHDNMSKNHLKHRDNMSRNQVKNCEIKSKSHVLAESEIVKKEGCKKKTTKAFKSGNQCDEKISKSGKRPNISNQDIVEVSEDDDIVSFKCNHVSDVTEADAIVSLKRCNVDMTANDDDVVSFKFIPDEAISLDQNLSEILATKSSKNRDKHNSNPVLVDISKNANSATCIASKHICEENKYNISSLSFNVETLCSTNASKLNDDTKDKHEFLNIKKKTKGNKICKEKNTVHNASMHSKHSDDEKSEVCSNMPSNNSCKGKAAHHCIEKHSKNNVGKKKDTHICEEYNVSNEKDIHLLEEESVISKSKVLLKSNNSKKEKNKVLDAKGHESTINIEDDSFRKSVEELVNNCKDTLLSSSKIHLQINTKSKNNNSSQNLLKANVAGKDELEEIAVGINNTRIKQKTSAQDKSVVGVKKTKQKTSAQEKTTKHKSCTQEETTKRKSSAQKKTTKRQINAQEESAVDINGTKQKTSVQEESIVGINNTKQKTSVQEKTTKRKNSTKEKTTKRKTSAQEESAVGINGTKQKTSIQEESTVGINNTKQKTSVRKENAVGIDTSKQKTSAQEKNTKRKTSVQEESAVDINGTERKTSVQEESTVGINNTKRKTSTQEENAVGIDSTKQKTSAQEKNTKRKTSAQEESAVGINNTRLKRKTNAQEKLIYTEKLNSENNAKLNTCRIEQPKMNEPIIKNIPDSISLKISRGITCLASHGVHLFSVSTCAIKKHCYNVKTKRIEENFTLLKIGSIISCLLLTTKGHQGIRINVGQANGYIAAYKIKTNKKKKKKNMGGMSVESCIGKIALHSRVQCLAHSCGWIFAGLQNGSVEKIQIKNFIHKGQATLCASPVMAIHVLSHGLKDMLIVCQNGVICVYNFETQLSRFFSIEADLSALTVLSNSLLYCAGNTPIVSYFTTKEGELVGCEELPSRVSVMTLMGSKLVLCLNDGTVQVYDTQYGNHIYSTHVIVKGYMTALVMDSNKNIFVGTDAGEIVPVEMPKAISLQSFL